MSDSRQFSKAAELEAMISRLGANGNDSTDTFYTWRLAYNFAVMFSAAIWLLFNSPEIAQTLTDDQESLRRLQGFLYFRGWFLAVVLAIGCYAYFRNWYPAIVFSCALLIGTLNLVFDLFTIYPEILAHPTPLLTLSLFVRFSLLWVIGLAVKNVSRIPEVKDRINLLLPFRANA